MITPEEKDKVIAALIAIPETTVLIRQIKIPDLKASKNEFYLIIDQLKEKGLIKSPDYSNIEKTANLYDFWRLGGFVGQEEILKANLEKLNSELLILSDKIVPSQAERIKNITEVASAIASWLSLFSK